MSNKIEIHTLKRNSKIYLLLEDVIEYISEIAGTEDTDVRNRFTQACFNLLSLKNKNENP